MNLSANSVYVASVACSRASSAAERAMLVELLHKVALARKRSGVR